MDKGDDIFVFYEGLGSSFSIGDKFRFAGYDILKLLLIPWLMKVRGKGLFSKTQIKISLGGIP